MGLFGKNKKGENEKNDVPQLPSLPKLPEFPGMNDSDYGMSEIHRLPSFPSSSLGTKFSQNTIKEAVTGGEEGDISDGEANDFSDEDNMRMMQPPLRRPSTEEMSSRLSPSRRFPEMTGTTPSSGPVFIRVDKFKDALGTFNETKRRIIEMEKVLENIKEVKEKEDRELQSWESEIKSMKDQIEKVDREVFSRM